MLYCSIAKMRHIIISNLHWSIQLNYSITFYFHHTVWQIFFFHEDTSDRAIIRLSNILGCGGFSIKILSYMYRNSHYKDKTVSQPSHFITEIPVQSKLRLCSANHRSGYWSNLPCDWLSTAWAYSEQESENRPRWDGVFILNQLVVDETIHQRVSFPIVWINTQSSNGQEWTTHVMMKWPLIMQPH